MKCTTCQDRGEIESALEGIGRLTEPCPDCAGKAQVAAAKASACAHAETTPGFMPGTFYCKACPAKLRTRHDGTFEIQIPEDPR